MTVIVTHCDKYFFSRTVALVQSLRNNEKCPEIWILAHDSETHELFTRLSFPSVHLISNDDFLEQYAELEEAHQVKSSIDFMFTITPFLMLYVREKTQSSVWYVDADTYFFGNFSQLELQVEGKDVVVSGHNFSERLVHLEIYGKYNVGIVYMSGSKAALEAISWWAAKCIEDTSLFESIEVYGDQKYLDKFPEFKMSFHIFDSDGDCAAPWNLERLGPKNEIISYHFSGFRNYRFFNITGVSQYSFRLKKWHRKRIYRPYFREISRIERNILGRQLIDSRKLSRRAKLNSLRYFDWQRSFWIK